MLSMAAFNCYVFSITSGKNSLLGGTMEFAADQRIRAALSIEKQWNLCGVRKWRIVRHFSGDAEIWPSCLRTALR
jgi:hypothetical protein